MKDVCGDYAAVYGGDLGNIHKNWNIDGVRSSDMKRWIREADARGGINTIPLHLDHPVTGRNAWDNTWVVGDLLPGGPAHDGFLKTWDLIVDFLNVLRREDGQPIPIVLRPYHEHSKRWPWWGRTSSYEDDFVSLWRMRVTRLRDTGEIHHLLYVISPQDVVDESDYLDGYPGDAYVDIFGLDYYKIWKRSEVELMGKTLSMVAKLAERHGKISALRETGID
ncbi:MAG: hypothetical protein GWQ05_21150 [Verrucomicrobiaceae bacterium]|nr:hypothetical protein [Verrucomicrobiaceae bacterium]